MIIAWMIFLRNVVSSPTLWTRKHLAINFHKNSPFDFANNRILKGWVGDSPSLPSGFFQLPPPLEDTPPLRTLQCKLRALWLTLVSWKFQFSERLVGRDQLPPCGDQLPNQRDAEDDDVLHPQTDATECRAWRAGTAWTATADELYDGGRKVGWWDFGSQVHPHR